MQLPLHAIEGETSCNCFCMQLKEKRHAFEPLLRGIGLAPTGYIKTGVVHSGKYSLHPLSHPTVLLLLHTLPYPCFGVHRS